MVTPLNLRVASLALGIGLFATPGDSFPTESGEDTGGTIQMYAAEISRLNKTGRRKVIAGLCASACTMYLGVRRVCVEPHAELWFHAAHLPGEQAPDPLGSLLMLSHYPEKVRAWAIASGALEKTEWDGGKVLTGRQLIRMGVPSCRPRSRARSSAAAQISR